MSSLRRLVGPSVTSDAQPLTRRQYEAIQQEMTDKFASVMDE